ncbi:MAG: hypothetical protein U1E56_06755 [Bauldia sp.]
MAALAGADDLIAEYLDGLPGFRRVPTGGRGTFFEPVRISEAKDGTILSRDVAVASDYLTVEFSSRTIVRRGQ